MYGSIRLRVEILSDQCMRTYRQKRPCVIRHGAMRLPRSKATAARAVVHEQRRDHSAARREVAAAAAAVAAAVGVPTASCHSLWSVG